MRILVTGAGGQVGAALVRVLRGRFEVLGLDRAGLDLRDAGALREIVARAQPDAILNAAAYTAVDRAEAERDAAFAVNHRAVTELAAAARAAGALLVHFSTDYVFDGTKSAPYAEDDATHPLNIYGESKLAGERTVAASGCRHFILRTSWVYAPEGRNFVNAILAAAKTRPDLRVVDDQRGAPTPAPAIADAVARLLSDVAWRDKSDGIYHMTAAGETTWYGFAQEILRERAPGVRLIPVTTEAYGATAPRPRNSLLDNAKLRAAFGIALPDWREGFRACFAGVH